MTFNLALDLDRFTVGTPYQEFSELRRKSPVSWQVLPQRRGGSSDGFWLVTGYREVVEASKNADAFCSNLGTLLVDHPPVSAKAPWTMIKNELCSLDGSIHTQYRSLVAPGFGAKAIAKLDGAIRSIAVSVFDDAFSTETFDFAEKLAVAFPAQVVLGELLGLPKGDHAQAAYWSDVLHAPEDPHFRHTPNAPMRAVGEMYEYACALVRDRRKSPRGDLVSMLALTTLADGTPLSDEMFTHYFWSMILGAFDTTASTIAGGTLALMERPAILEKLRDQPSLLESAIEEMLRWVTPVIYFRRTATRNIVLGGQQIAKGDRVALCYPAAHRDEDIFDNPNEFNIERSPNPHLAFGVGRHFCLGARLARLELKVFFEEFFKRKISLQGTGPVLHVRSNFVNRIRSFPVRVLGRAV